MHFRVPARRVGPDLHHLHLRAQAEEQQRFRGMAPADRVRGWWRSAAGRRAPSSIAWLVAVRVLTFRRTGHERYDGADELPSRRSPPASVPIRPAWKAPRPYRFTAAGCPAKRTITRGVRTKNPAHGGVLPRHPGRRARPLTSAAEWTAALARALRPFLRFVRRAADGR